MWRGESAREREGEKERARTIETVPERATRAREKECECAIETAPERERALERERVSECV